MSSNKVVIIELGCANTASVKFALERLGADVTLTADATEIVNAPRVVLPGVGAAGYVMGRIHELGLYDTIRGLSQPLLGVCLGQQLLFESSEEGDVDCLGLIPGKVRQLTARPDLVVPHMGWNQLTVTQDDPLTEGLTNGDYAYFVHSFVCPVNEHTLITSDYDGPFAASVRKGNVWGCQFHPERSSAAGAKILDNFLKVSL
ncbi:MAG: imidazole glycerol phosphate synthase subunit HisH [Asticcacaulis sp.]